MNKLINVGMVFGMMSLVVGCGGGEGFTADAVNEVSGAAGKAVVSKSGAAGVVGVAGGTVVAGSNGVAGDAGVAGSVTVSGAAGQDPTNPNCRPKTCATVAMELSGNDTAANSCGKVSDGCGGWVDCGDCNGAASGSGYACGETITENGNILNIPNLCGIPCWVDTKRIIPTSNKCGTINSMGRATYCTNDTVRNSMITSGKCVDAKNLGADLCCTVVG